MAEKEKDTIDMVEVNGVWQVTPHHKDRSRENDVDPILPIVLSVIVYSALFAIWETLVLSSLFLVSYCLFLTILTFATRLWNLRGKRRGAM